VDAHGEIVVEGDLLIEEATGEQWVVVDGSGPAAEPTVVLERAGIAGGRRKSMAVTNGRLEGYVTATW